MDEQMTLNDGTVIQGHLAETETRLFLYMYGVTMEEAFDALKTPENTKVIRWTRYGEKGTARGYKHLVTISEENGGMICAGLKKN